jgi:hypothetical protein
MVDYGLRVAPDAKVKARFEQLKATLPPTPPPATAPAAPAPSTAPATAAKAAAR